MATCIPAASAFSAPSAAAPPNVIIVLADDQGYGDLSAHGHPEIETPNLDRLAGESVRLTDFHVSAMCTPTRAQLMTGRDCLATGAMNVSSGRSLMRTDLPVISELFRKYGYGTGIFGKWHLGDTYPYRPEDRGFKETVWYPSSHIGSVPDAWNNDYFNDAYRHNGKVKKYRGYSGDVFFEEAMKWMERTRKRGPFFAYIPLNVAHTPLFVPANFKEAYRSLPESVARYSAMIANIDYNMGRLDEMLRRAGLRENTIVVYLSDNGATRSTMRYNAGMRGAKAELYEGGHRAPCFVRWPAGKLSSGRDVQDLTIVQDLLPTLAELCGVPIPSGLQLDGLSLAGVLREPGNEVPDRVAVIQYSRMPVRPGATSRPQKNDAALLWRKWRLIGGKELYDIATDPGQEANQITRHPEIAAMLQRHYDQWWARVEPSLDQFLPLVVGSVHENPVLASSCEWADVFLDLSAQVRSGERKNGVWHLEVARAGDYEVALRRWPRGCDAAISAGIPAHRSEDGGYPAGVAIPIAKARLKLGHYDRTIDVDTNDREATFRMSLAVGRTTMQSWFLDDDGTPLLGAYYAYVFRK